MKNLILILALFIGTLVSAQSDWKSDNVHSKVGFGITHLMISEVTGHFGEYTISATANDDFSNADFTVEINTTSIDTDNTRRDDDLRSDSFFDVEKYPTMQFKTTSTEKTGDKTFDLIGDLTIKGITKTVTLKGKVNGVIINTRSKKFKAGLKITGSINRLDFQVGNESASVGNEVEIVINLEMAQQ